MKKILIGLVMYCACLGTMEAQTWKRVNEENRVVIGSFWDNWFVQAGLDMTLQLPYGKDWAQVFPKGKTFVFRIKTGVCPPLYATVFYFTTNLCFFQGK